MNPYLKKTIIAASPLACTLVNAAPTATFLNVSPPGGAVVGIPQTLLRGKVSHDIYPAALIHAAINGKPLALDPQGNFSSTVKLTPGNNVFTLRASTPNPRQQMTQISTYLDGSMIYGSDATRANALRSFQGGMLKTSGGFRPPVKR